MFEMFGAQKFELLLPGIQKGIGRFGLGVGKNPLKQNGKNKWKK